MQPTDIKFKLSQTLTLKDLITIVSIAVSLTLAWGVFSTRMLLIEKQLEIVVEQVEKNEKTVNKLKDTLRQIEQQQRIDGLSIDRLYEDANKQPPRRFPVVPVPY